MAGLPSGKSLAWRGGLMALLLSAGLIGGMNQAAAQQRAPQSAAAGPSNDAGAPNATAEAPEPTRTLTVFGNGEASAPPDIAFIDTGVVTQAPNAADALAANSKAMDALFDGLAEMGVAKKDMQTTRFSVHPVYSQPKDSNETPTIRGYEVTNQVTVTIRDLDGMGKALDRLVALGSNRLDSIRFAIENPEPVLDEARKQATANARHKAELYAQAAGLSLGPVLAMTEGTAPPEPPRPMMRMMAAEAAVPVASGEQTVNAAVTMVFALQ